jgi:hypothetical protein
MDNLGSHKSLAIRQMVRTAGARLWDLPPYSPVLDPIEQAYTKIKHRMWAGTEANPRSDMAIPRQPCPSLQRSECSNYFATARICFRQNLKRLELARHRSTGPAMRAVLAATAAASAALGITAWLQQSRLISDERPRLPCSRSTISPVTRSGTVGLSEHIISGLSHPRSLFLVARTSSEHQDTRPARKRSAGSLA